MRDFTVGPVVRNPPAREHGLAPWYRKTSHITGQLSPSITTIEPT